MRLEPLYRVRFTYPESWSVGLDGGWQQMFFMAEGRCEGSVTGRFRGANFPRKEGADGPFRPDFRAVIETDDGRTIVGVVLRETAAEATVFQTDRTVVTVAANSIVERQKTKISAMPDGYAMFGSDQLADLTAYLLTLKHAAPLPAGQADAAKSN